MAKAKEAPEEQAAEEGAEGGDETGAIKKSAKKKLIIIGVVGILLLLVIVGGLFAAGVFSKKEPKDEAKTEEGQPPAEGEGDKAAAPEGEKGAPVDAANKVLYMNIGEFLVNLNASGKQASFLKMSTTLQVQGEVNKKAVEDNLPRIKDTFQTYLRELRAEDLKGSAGVYRLREALLLRVNKVIAPAQVTDILFEELIVQ